MGTKKAENTKKRDKYLIVIMLSYEIKAGLTNVLHDMRFFIKLWLQSCNTYLSMNLVNQTTPNL